MTPETTPLKWQIHKLGEPIISDKIKAGGTPLKSLEEYWKNGTIPFVKIEDMTSSQKYLYKTRDKITEKGLLNSSAWIVPEQSILFSMYASYGEVVINKVPVSTNQAIIAINPSKNVELEYFYYYLANLKSTIHKYIRETTQKNLNAEIVKNFDFILPPLIEQRGIASVLGTVDEAIRRTDAVIEKAEELKRGLMQRLLTQGIGHTEFKQTELGEIPKTWEIYRIRKVSRDIQYGYTASAKNNPVGPKFLRITDIKEGAVDWQDVPYCECGNSDYKKYKLNRGDLLFARTGATTGKSYLVNKEKDAVFASYLIRLIPKENIDPYYLSVFFDSHLYWRQIQKSIVGSAQGGVNATTLSNLILPFPPKKEQEKIATIINDFNNKIKLEKKNKRIIEENKKGLMQILLSGKVRVELRENGLYKLKKYEV